MSKNIKPLLLFFLLFAQVYVYSQNLKRVVLPSSTLSEVYELGNENIKIFIDKETGKYFLKTINNKDIFFNDSTRPDFFTSHMNVKVDDSVYSNEAMVARNCFTNTLATNVVVNKDYCLAEYKVKSNKITITQKLWPVQYYNMSFVVIEITIKNNDVIPHDVGILLEFDWQINGSNKDNFKTNKEIITNETLFTSNSIPFLWRAYENFQSSDFVIQNFLKGNFYFTTNSQDKIEVNVITPDIFVLGGWEKIFSVIWDYQHKENVPIMDGASLMRWNEKPISPNSEVTHYACMGEAKGTIRDGEIIVNNVDFDKIEYNGIKYKPDTLENYTLVYNASNKAVENIYSSIVFPYNLVSNNLIQKAIPENLQPGGTGIIKYSIIPKLSEISKTEQLTENIFSSLENFSINYSIYIPEAPDADTLPPDISFSENNCSFTVSILDDKANDKGINYVVIENDNILYNINSSRGDKLVTINGSLYKTDVSGSIKVMAFDMAGNYKEKSFEIIPTLYGFDDEDLRSGYAVCLPFKKKSDKFDTLVFCKIKFDPTTLMLDKVPILQQSNHIGKFNLNIVDQTTNEISFSIYNADGLPNGALAFINFVPLLDNALPTTITVEELLVNDDPNNCTYSYSSNISFQSKDIYSPSISGKQFGCRLFLTIEEKNIDDRGIYCVYLSGERNTTIIMDDLKPGVKEANIIIACTDSSRFAEGQLIIIDGAGNRISHAYSINPLLIKMDTVISQLKGTVIFTPQIYGNLYDRTIYNYSFSVSYDTTVLTPVPPYFDVLNTANINYYINYDISTKGKVVVIASGSTPLVGGDIINLFFKVNVGEDIISDVRFDYFYLKYGATAVHTTDGVIIRQNNMIAPQIFISKNSCEYEVRIFDKYGIDKIELKGINNVIDSIKFLVPFNRYDTVASFKVYPVNYKQPSSFVVLISDSTGFYSEEAYLKPIKVSLPKDINIIGQKVNEIPIFIEHSDIPINNIYMLISYDERIIDQYDIPVISTGTLLENSDITYEFIPPNMIRIRANNIQKNNLDILLKLNVWGNKVLDFVQGAISIDSLSINNTLCSFGESALLHIYASEVFDFSVPSSSSGQIGQEIAIPIYSNSSELKNYIFTELKFYISFNPKVLKPISVHPIKDINMNEFESSFSYDPTVGQLVITFTGNGQIDLFSTWFVAKVLLSNVDFTPITIDSVSLIQSNDNNLIIQTVLHSGVFQAKRFEWLEGLLVKEDRLFQNHPNPYNSSTVIRFAIKDKTKTELTIYDIMGRVVSKPVNSTLDAGQYQINFDASMLTSGVYFYQLKTERYSEIKKMVLLK
jgi:hypothetical protein